MISQLKIIFRLKNEKKVIKDRILRNISEWTMNYHKPVRVSNFWSNKDKNRNKTLSVEKYLNKIKWYLKDILNILKKSDPREIHLTIAANFIFSKDNDEERVIHLKSDKIEIMINDRADEAIKELFKSIKNR